MNTGEHGGGAGTQQTRDMPAVTIWNGLHTRRHNLCYSNEEGGKTRTCTRAQDRNRRFTRGNSTSKQVKNTEGQSYQKCKRNRHQRQQEHKYSLRGPWAGAVARPRFQTHSRHWPPRHTLVVPFTQVQEKVFCAKTTLYCFSLHQETGNRSKRLKAVRLLSGQEAPTGRTADSP